MTPEGWVMMKEPCEECGSNDFHISGCTIATKNNLRTIGGTYKKGNMSANNGVIRIGRKGIKKFAFGDDGAVFEVDVVVAFQEWIGIDESFRPIEVDASGNRPIPLEAMQQYHRAAVDFVKNLSADHTPGSGTGKPADINAAEALDFIARLREQYDALADFFQPKLRDERASPDSSGAELRFSVEGA